MDKLGAMRVFTTVADAGSLSAAGRKLGMPLATVSRQLAALEEHTGARLVTRTTRHLTLTEQGRHYLDSCRRVLEEVETAERRLGSRLHTSRLERLGVPAFAAEAVRRFHAGLGRRLG